MAAPRLLAGCWRDPEPPLAPRPGGDGCWRADPQVRSIQDLLVQRDATSRPLHRRASARKGKALIRAPYPSSVHPTPISHGQAGACSGCSAARFLTVPCLVVQGWRWTSFSGGDGTMRMTSRRLGEQLAEQNSALRGLGWAGLAAPLRCRAVPSLRCIVAPESLLSAPSILLRAARGNLSGSSIEALPRQQPRRATASSHAVPSSHRRESKILPRTTASYGHRSGLCQGHWHSSIPRPAPAAALAASGQLRIPDVARLLLRRLSVVVSLCPVRCAGRSRKLDDVGEAMGPLRRLGGVVPPGSATCVFIPPFGAREASIPLPSRAIRVLSSTQCCSCR